MAEVAAAGNFSTPAPAVSALAQPSRSERWLHAALPVATVLVVLIGLWYLGSAYFNLQYLNSFHQSVDTVHWQRLSFSSQLHDALTSNQAVMPTPLQTGQDLLTRLQGTPNPGQMMHDFGFLFKQENPMQALRDFGGQLDNQMNTGSGLWIDLFWTGRVAVLGFLLGAFIGIALALLFMSSRLVSQSLLPYVVASQTIPIVALVPAILVTIGTGLRSEILISAYLAFFSITVSTYKGLQSVQPIAFELMRSYAASPRQVFLKLRLPAALPFLFTGLKIGVTASLVGAVIAELPSGSSHGLGQGLVAASTYSQNIQLWSTMMAAALLGLFLYGLVVLTEKLLVRWRVEPTA